MATHQATYNPDDPNIPIDTRDLLFIATYGKVAALNKTTGHMVWKNKMPGCGYGIADISYDPVGILLAVNGGKIVALQPQTGAELWRNKVPGYNFHTVVIPRGQAFPPRPPRASAPRPPPHGPNNQALTATQLGLYDKLGDPIPVQEQPLYRAPLELQQQGISTQSNLPEGMQPPNPIVYVGGHGHVAGLDKRTGQELWKTSLPGTGWNTVELIEEDNMLFAASMGHVFALDPRTGHILWTNNLPGMGHTWIQMATTLTKNMGGVWRYTSHSQGDT